MASLFLFWSYKKLLIFIDEPHNLIVDIEVVFPFEGAFIAYLQ